MSYFFSVVIPIFNAEKTISDTLDSLLAQTYKNYELILINDCSTDNSLSIINKIKIKFNDIIIINNDINLGVANSRNKGFEAASGEYIALLDSDDIWIQNKLKKQKEFIDKTNCDICCTSYNFIDINNNVIKSSYIVPENITYKMLLKENYIGCSSAVIKKNLLVHNKMNSSYFHEDYALWLYLSRKNAKIVGMNDVLMQYRIINNSRSHDKINAALNRFKIYTEQEKFGLIKSLYYFSLYAINGVKKKFL